MATLDGPRTAAVLDAARACASAQDVEEFRHAAVAALHTVVACDAVAYNEISLAGDLPLTLIDPDDMRFEDADAILAEHAEDNPLITHYARTGDVGAYMFSDFLTLTQLRATDLYNLLYRPMGLERQMAIGLPSSDSLIIGMTVNRAGRAFSETDRTALNLLGPHLTESLRAAAAVEGLSAALEAAATGVVIIDTAGHIVHATPLALESLGRWFEPDDAVPTRAPEELCQWLALQRRRTTDPALDEPATVYADRRGSTALQIRYLSRVAGHDVLRIVEERDGLTLPDIRGLGLTPRQSEVLLGIANGLTNDQIARQIDARPATVRKHVEHIFTRLGVTSRAEAVAVAYRQARSHA